MNTHKRVLIGLTGCLLLIITSVSHGYTLEVNNQSTVPLVLDGKTIEPNSQMSMEAEWSKPKYINYQVPNFQSQKFLILHTVETYNVLFSITNSCSPGRAVLTAHLESGIDKGQSTSTFSGGCSQGNACRVSEVGNEPKDEMVTVKVTGRVCKY